MGEKIFVKKNELRSILVKNSMNQRDLSRLLHVSERSVSLKMNGKRGFTSSEVHDICTNLNCAAETFTQ